MGKFLTLLIVSLPILFGNLFAQNQEESPNRLSLGVYSTLTRGHLNVGTAFQSATNANFEFENQFTNTFGFNIRYVTSPELALQTNLTFGDFSLLSEFGDEQDLYLLENKYLTTSFSTQLSLLRLVGSNSQNFNLFGAIGAGMMFNNVSIEADDIANNTEISTSDHPFQTFYTSFGGGLRFNLGPRIDSFAQYEYNVANRDVIDGDFLGEAFDLSGSAKTSNSWSVFSFGIQFKFGSGSVDADWPTPLLPTGQSQYANNDVFEELEQKLIEQQEEFTNQIQLLNTEIDSLESRLEAERNTEQTSEERHSDIIKELLERIELLEQEIEQEKAKSNVNEQKINTLNTQLESLQSELANEQRARIELEEAYNNNIAELQTKIDSLESVLARVRSGEQFGQSTIDDIEENERDAADTEEIDTSTPAERRSEDEDPDLVARKEVDTSTEIASEIAPEEDTTELPVDGEEDEDELPDFADEPETVSNEPESPEYSSTDDVIADNDTADETPADRLDSDNNSTIEDQTTDTDDVDAAEGEQDKGITWVIYALLALIAASVIYFVSRLFKSENDDDRGNTNKGDKGSGPTPSTPPDTPTPTSEVAKKKDNVAYPVPEHSRTVDRKKSVSNTSEFEKDNISKSYSIAPHAIPEHSVIVKSNKSSKFSTSESNHPGSKTAQETQKKSIKSSTDKKNDAPTSGFFSMTLNEATGFFGDLFSLKSSKKQ